MFLNSEFNCMTLSVSEQIFEGRKLLHLLNSPSERVAARLFSLLQTYIALSSEMYTTSRND